MELLKNLSDFV